MANKTLGANGIITRERRERMTSSERRDEDCRKRLNKVGK